MITFQTLVEHPAVSALAWTLVHFLWQGAALALAVWLLSRALAPSANGRYAVGVLTLAAMLVAPAVTFGLLVGADDAARGAGTALAQERSAVPPAVSDASAPATMAIDAAAARAGRPAAALAAPVVAGLWLAGVLVLAGRLAGGWLVARRLSRRAVRPATPEIQALARRVAGRLALDRVVAVLESSAVAVPVLIGWVRPVILLPAAALSGLTPTQLEALLAHELAHVRRHDYLVNLLQSAVETLLFYHPAVWWVSRQVRAEREHCCDDLAVGVCDRVVYATALADLAAMSLVPRTALAATDGSLLARVRRILGGDDERVSGAPRWLPVSVIALLAAVLVPVALVSAGEEAAQRPVERPRVVVVPKVDVGDQAVVTPRRVIATPVVVGVTKPVGPDSEPRVVVAPRVVVGTAPRADQARGISQAELRRLQAELEALANALRNNTNTAEVEQRLRELIERLRASGARIEETARELAELAAVSQTADVERMREVEAVMAARAREIEEIAAARQVEDVQRVREIEQVMAERARELAEVAAANRTVDAERAREIEELLATRAREIEELAASGRDVDEQRIREVQRELAVRARELEEQRADRRAEVEARVREVERELAARAREVEQVAAVRERELGARLVDADRIRADERAVLERALVASSPAGGRFSGTGSFSWTVDGEQVDAAWSGPFRVSADGRDVASVEPGAFVRLSDGPWELSTGVEVRAESDGTLVRRFFRSGREVPYDAEAGEFLAEMLSRVARLGGGLQ